MPNRYIGVNVLEETLRRLESLYNKGHRVIYSFSGGKDSTVCLELGIIAARNTGNLPVDVVLRDEEIMFPGTYALCERTANRPEVDFRWIVANNMMVNAFSRTQPYWWTFDPECESKWVRRYPSIAEHIIDQELKHIVNDARFPPRNDLPNVVVTGVRAGESMNRRLSIYSSKGWLTKVNGNKKRRVIQARPIYDWSDGDVWKAIRDFSWDYNSAYGLLYRLGGKRSKLRIAPPCMNSAAVEILPSAAKAWPNWFDRVSDRIPGIRTAMKFGKRAVWPQRRLGETWEDCFKRTCVKDAPDWIRSRNTSYLQRKMVIHSKHSNAPFPEVRRCTRCVRNASWRLMCRNLFMGDPFGSTDAVLSWVRPEVFREDRKHGARHSTTTTA